MNRSGTLILGFRDHKKAHILGDSAVMIDSYEYAQCPVPKVMQCGNVLVGLSGKLIGNEKMHKFLSDKTFDTARDLARCWKPAKDCLALIVGPDCMLWHEPDDAFVIPPSLTWADEELPGAIAGVGCGADFALGYLAGIYDRMPIRGSVQNCMELAANHTNAYMPGCVRPPWHTLTVRW